MRYADYTPTLGGTVLRWALRPFRRAADRIERMPFLAPWERRAGPDYTGWKVRNLRGVRLLPVGEIGTVVRREVEGRHCRYVVAFDRTDYYTSLPAPEHVELLGPPQQ